MRPQIRSLREEDSKAVLEICRRTILSPPRDPRAREAFLLKWALPYLQHYPEHCFTALFNGRVTGYVLSAPQTRIYQKEVEPPYIKRALELLDSLPPCRDIESWKEIMKTSLAYSPQEAALLLNYPAHLHINVHPEFQRRGLGHLLMDALLEHYRRGSCPGIHLTAGAENTGGLSFYRKYGFKELPPLEQDSGAVILGMAL